MYSFKQNSNNFLASLQCNHANFLCLHYDRCEAVMRYDGIHGSGRVKQGQKPLGKTFSATHSHTHTVIWRADTDNNRAAISTYDVL